MTILGHAGNILYNQNSNPHSTQLIASAELCLPQIGQSLPVASSAAGSSSATSSATSSVVSSAADSSSAASSAISAVASSTSSDSAGASSVASSSESESSDPQAAAAASISAFFRYWLSSSSNFTAWLQTESMNHTEMISSAML